MVVDLNPFLILPAYKDHVDQILVSYDSPEGVLGKLVRQMADPLSTVTSVERARVVVLLFKQVQKDNDISGLLFEK